MKYCLESLTNGSFDINWVSQKFCNILVVCASLQRVYQVAEAIQPIGISAVVDSILVVDTLGIVSLYV